MSVPHETWAKCREDYVTGKGSLATVALKHGIKKGTVEKCAKREGWKELRSEFETRQWEKLSPPVLPAPVAPIPPPLPQSDLEKQLQRLVLQRDRIDLMIEKEVDPTKLDRLVSARSRLFEQWRILSNIPLPGSRKPPKERRRPDYMPLPEPTPIFPAPEEPIPIENATGQQPSP